MKTSKFWYRQVDRIHRVTSIDESQRFDLDHHEIAQFVLSHPIAEFQTHNGEVFIGHELIAFINGVKLPPGPALAIPAKSERSEFGRSID